MINLVIPSSELQKRFPNGNILGWRKVSRFVWLSVKLKAKYGGGYWVEIYPTTMIPSNMMIESILEDGEAFKVKVFTKCQLLQKMREDAKHDWNDSNYDSIQSF